MDIGKVLSASILIIAIGVGLTLLSFVLGVVPALVQGIPQIAGPVALIFGLLLLGYGLLQIPIFIILFIWAGMRASSKYGLSRGGAGLAAAFSYVVIGVIHLVLTIITNLIGVGSSAVGSALGQTSGDLAGMTMISGVVSGFGAVICTIGTLAMGLVMNFILGYIGGWIATRK